VHAVGFDDSTLILVAAALPSDAQNSDTESVAQIARIVNDITYLAQGRVIGMIVSNTNRLKLPTSMVAAFSSGPLLLRADHFAHLHKAHHWWLSHDPSWPAHVKTIPREEVVHVNVSMPKQLLQDVLEEGWWPLVVLNKKRKISDFKFKDLLHHRVLRKPPDSPKGHAACDAMTLKRWAEDKWSQEPFAYREEHLVVPMFPREGANSRRLIAQEEETLLGYPGAYTAVLMQRFPDPDISESWRKKLLSTAVPHGVVLLLLSCLTETVAASGSCEVSLNFNDMPLFQSDLLELLSRDTV
jgi:hypothetical protein